jgi:hypothetical protein
MNRRHRVSAAYEKRDWGSGSETWRPASRRRLGRITTRRLSNRRAKRALLSGGAIKAY